MRSCTKTAWALATLAVLSASAARAQQTTTTFNFDDISAGTSVNTLVPAGSGIGFFPAVRRVDENGNLIQPAQYTIDPDPTVPPVTVAAASLPGGGNALDAELGPLLVLFDPNVYLFGIDAFSLVLDDYLNPPAFVLPILFYNANDTQVLSVNLSRANIGQTISPSVAGLGVQKVVLPGGAFYDNLRVTGQAIPEPSTAILVGMSLLVLASCWGKRRRRTGEAG